LSDVPSDFPLHAKLQETGVTDYCRGGSAIAGPDGSWVIEPVVGEERLVMADLDLRRVAEERQNFAPTGHYSRADVFIVQVDRRRLEAVRFTD
jgi:nitrilase